MKLIRGSCLEVLKDISDSSVDSIVTDPPAGIAFMSKAWDEDKGGRDQWIAWLRDVMKECLRVLKPGAHGLVWALPRTSHWTATALEDAGFEIRDVVTHIFGSGFPKSYNVAQSIEKLQTIGRARRADRNLGKGRVEGSPNQRGYENLDTGGQIELTTDVAKKWQGYGTALKPASEHWILVRKPISEKTIAVNVLKHGVGGINIDGSRIEFKSERDKAKVLDPVSGEKGYKHHAGAMTGLINRMDVGNPNGRFPANLVLSHNEDCDDKCSEGCAVSMLDEQSVAGGMHSAGKSRPKQKHIGDFGVNEHGNRERLADHRFGDSGGASRFFYCAKASKSDKGTENIHPTVKNTKLMQYLIKLVTPKDGVVLDPFMGSGSTGVAAIKEGFGFIGIEREEEYLKIAEARCEHAKLLPKEKNT